jgi:hypothetical protein
MKEVAPEPALLDRLEQEARRRALAQAQVGAERREQVCRDAHGPSATLPARMAVPALLDRLLRAHGPSGHEQLAFDVVREAVGEVAEIETDSVGNLVARRPRRRAAAGALRAPRT